MYLCARLMKGSTSIFRVASYPSVGARLQDYTQLLKFRLTSSVVFSAAAGYLLAAESFNWSTFLALILGGFLVVGSSNAYNQVWERDRDALMNRTKNRPLAAGRLTPFEAIVISTISLICGAGLLMSINPLSAAFGLASVVLYTLVYTPMKARSPWAVFVGAFPGAIPFMLGWVAATNDFDIEPGVLFAVQFLWQFPHFWAIGWVAFEDYAKAGYYLLPNRERNKGASMMIITYTLWMIFVSILPVFGFTGALTLHWISAIVIVGLGVWMLWHALKLHREQTGFAARRLMLTSVAYLPLVQIIYVIDRYLF